MVMVRRAEEKDRKKIASFIIEIFKNDFSILIRREKEEYLQNFFEECIRVKNFFIAENEIELIGIAAITDCNGRLIYQSKKTAQKYFGRCIGFIIYFTDFKEMEKIYCTSESAGFIEFVAIKKNYQGKGIASFMLKEAIAMTDYKTYLLDTLNTNYAAIKCYMKLGFSEIRREKLRFTAQKKHTEKIFMEYIK